MAPVPLFIVLEGIDGSGTTTQTELLSTHLRSRGRAVLDTREPSTGPVGRLLREILRGGHQVGTTPVSGDTMALLFAADRRDHLQREIEPALASGKDVVCDRYQWSSLAYQAGEANQAWVASLARGLREPDATILIDLPIDRAAERRRLAGRVEERYDDDGYLERVAEAYRRLAATGARAYILDGTPSIESVARAVRDIADHLLATGQAERPARASFTSES